VLAHPLAGRAAAMLSRELDATVAGLDQGADGDGEAFRRLFADWTAMSRPFLDALLRPFPPVRAGAALTRTVGLTGLRELTRLGLMPLRRFVQEHFVGDQAALLFAGCALHADLTPEASGSALFGWLLVCLGQQVGFPVPVGGAGAITDALVSRAAHGGVDVRCGVRVERIHVRGGRATAVATADGDVVAARYAVLADCDAAHLFTSMVGLEHLPPAYAARIGRIQRSSGTFKVDWALSGPIPWSDPAVATAGTVHIADGLDELSVAATQLAIGHVPAAPFLLVGQMTTADPSRSPPGTESAWAYTHVPSLVRGDAGGGGITGRWDTDDCRRFTDRIEGRIERLAPGFGALIMARHVMAPPDLQRADANLVGGDIGGGTAQLHQQAIFRPVSGLARPETPVRRLYLASASAHPGGAVHGACGANAARAAIVGRRLRR